MQIIRETHNPTHNSLLEGKKISFHILQCNIPHITLVRAAQKAKPKGQVVRQLIQFLPLGADGLVTKGI